MLLLPATLPLQLLYFSENINEVINTLCNHCKVMLHYCNFYSVIPH